MTISGPNGQLVEGIEMEIADTVERWNTISLVNGDMIRMKCVVTQVFAIPGARDAQGNQMYIVLSSNVMSLRKDLPRATLEEPAEGGKR